MALGGGEEGPYALHEGLVFRPGGEGGVGDEVRRGGLGVLEGLEIQLQAPHLEGGQAVLPGAEEVSRPRRARSSREISKPSLVLHRAFSRFRVSGFRLELKRTQ